MSTDISVALQCNQDYRVAVNLRLSFIEYLRLEGKQAILIDIGIPDRPFGPSLCNPLQFRSLILLRKTGDFLRSYGVNKKGNIALGLEYLSRLETNC